MVLGTITILTTDRQSNSKDLNQVLTDAGHLILARLGVNVQKGCIEHCTGLISLAIEGEADKINALLRKLKDISGIKAELNIMAEDR